MTESLLLGLGGGSLGLLLAWWGTEALLRLIPEDVPRLAEINLDHRVFGFTLLISVVTGVVFGLVAGAAGVEDRIDRSDEGRLARRGRRVAGRARLRNALVVAEIAIALVVLIGAGCCCRHFTGCSKWI